MQLESMHYCENVNDIVPDPTIEIDRSSITGFVESRQGLQ